MENYKLSEYNIFIPFDELEKNLLYNSFTNILLEVSKYEMEIISTWPRNATLSNEQLSMFPLEILKILIFNGILVKEDIDERKYVKDNIIKKKSIFTKTRKFQITILPTNNCNLSCPYCFEGQKTKHVSKESNYFQNPENDNVFFKFLESELSNPAVEIVKGLEIHWFGGEPLLSLDVIERISKKCIEFSKQNNLEFKNIITTNGTLLTKDVWQVLSNVNMSEVMICIDGNETLHNTMRPYKDKNLNSYHSILNNLTNLPKDITLKIRINADKNTTAGLGELLIDLDKYSIWPNKYDQIEFIFGIKFDFETCKDKKSQIFKIKEFYKEREKFRKQRWEYFNNKIDSKAKLRFKFPEVPPSFICGTARNPLGIVIDEKGYLHKCWLRIGNKENAIQHISEPLNLNNSELRKWIDFNKFDFSEECNNCKFLPICRQDCPREHYDNQVVCSEWKYMLFDYFKDQLIRLEKQPETIKIPKNIHINTY